MAADAGAASAAASRARRRRGYDWEDALAKRFNASPGWRAFRLGSPSVGLPDVLAVNTRRRSLFVMEAKSATSASLRVPAEQVARCVEWARMLDAYGDRRVVLAFKFLSKRRVGAGAYERRRLVEHYKEWPAERAGGRTRWKKAADCSCAYGGQASVRAAGGGRGRWKPAPLEDCAMPFAPRGGRGAARAQNSM